MNNKRLVDFIQNLTLLLLTASAIYLLTCFPMLDGVLTGKVQNFLTRPDSSMQQSSDITAAIGRVHLVVTDQFEYGRYSNLNIMTDEAEFQRLVPLLREAIGSAAAGEPVTKEDFRAALELPGIYVDLTVSLPTNVIAAWLKESYAGEGDVRAFGLFATGETAVLYLCAGDGGISRCTTALTSAAVREMTAMFAPNGGRFAFESEYETLAPYTVLSQDVPSVSDLQVSIPAGYTAYNLLTALEFNAHTTSRYHESSGVEVVMQSPLTLRIGSDGTVRYSTDGGVPPGLYRVACAGTVPTAQEALQNACAIARVLCTGTGAGNLSLDSVKQTEQGWIITFYYQINGFRIHLAGDREALRIVISGDEVVNFEFYCRNYTMLEQSAVILPPSMATAIAARYEGAELALAYVDNGTDLLSAQWLAQ